MRVGLGFGVEGADLRRVKVRESLRDLLQRRNWKACRSPLHGQRQIDRQTDINGALRVRARVRVRVRVTLTPQEKQMACRHPTDIDRQRDRGVTNAQSVPLSGGQTEERPCI